MHERALITDLVREIVRTAEAAGAERVTRIEVRLGALSHFTPEHFLEHYVDAAHDTIGEGAEVHATLDTDINAPHAADVVLETIEIQVPDREQAA